jgi:hypothetical protein
LLAAAGRIGRWQVAVDALYLGTRVVEARDREQTMPDHLGAKRFQCRAGLARLIGRTLRLRERIQVICVESAAWQLHRG